MIVYLTDAVNALIGPVELPVTPGLGVQLPSNGVEFNEALPDPEPGQLWAWINGESRQLSDCRGAVFSILNGEQLEWTQLGEVPAHLTAEPWPGAHYIWLQGGWQLDADAKRESLIKRALASRDGLLQQAAIRIAPLQDAMELDEGTEEEKAALIEWKRYRVALNRIEQEEEFPLNIDWPIAPLTIERFHKPNQIPQ